MNKKFISISLFAMCMTGCAEKSAVDTSKTQDDAFNEVSHFSQSAHTIVKAMVDSRSRVCGVEYNYEQVIDEVNTNVAFAILAAVNSTSKDTGEILLSNIDKTIDCNDNDQWVTNIRDYLKSDEYKEIVRNNLEN